MIAAFERVRTQNQELRQVQDNAGAVFKDLAKRSILDGTLLENVVLEQGKSATISHTLGRPLVGWIIVRRNHEAAVWDGQDTNRTPTRTLVLNNGLTDPLSTMTISLWVF